ncbi:M48 family metallopeptidase [Azospira restricta]|uniref:M48 family metallopeptidase n=1 Tax=Azospira restricta TaxID=404405 RepID=A0A974PYV1_9RHOO|nr:M48 family metallopeptidase [Azospira restricta]
MNRRLPFGPFPRRTLPRQVLSAVLCVSLVLSPPLAYADSLPDLGESARADLPPQLERKIGESIMNDIRLHEPTYVDDPEVNEYLGRLGQRLVAASAEPGGDFHFFAIRDSQVNAFAMFGGYIGVNTGTILTSQSESELAGVIAHEVSHVTQHHLARQISSQKQQSVLGMIAMAVALLAMRSNSQAAGAAIAGSEAAFVQSQLAFSRDFEREADRVGYEILQKAGFDPRGMSDFFERLQRSTRVYENNAPVYMRSHPITVERISDMQNRLQQAPYRQVRDSLDYQLVRAKLRAQQGTPKEAIADFESLLRDRKFASETATRYGLAFAQLRAKHYAAAEREVEALRRQKGGGSAMIENLAGEIRAGAGDLNAAAAIFRDALLRFPLSRALAYGYADALFSLRQYDRLESFLDEQLQSYTSDSKLYGLQAKTHAVQGRKLQQHRALAEMYVLQGRLLQAIEQLQFAQRAGDGNFYEQSVVDARLRELKKQQAEEAKQKK